MTQRAGQHSLLGQKQRCQQYRQQHTQQQWQQRWQ
jgi:hypothetical protein